MPKPKNFLGFPLVDMTGRVFGRWTVIKYVGNRKWLLKCSCPLGTEKEIDGRVLRKGASASCGCLRKESNIRIGKVSGKQNVWKMIAANVKYSEKESGDRLIFKQYKSNSKIRKIDFLITYEDFREFLHKKCYYCDSEPNTEYHLIRKRKTKTTDQTVIYNGLDRIDVTKGYELDNLVSCCSTCNYLKRGLTVENFFLWIKNIHSYSWKEKTVPNNKYFSNIYVSYRSRSIKSNIVFNIDRDKFCNLTLQDCFYCGDTPSNIYKKRKKEIRYNGLDRVDNTKGYEIDNVVPCCSHCNRAKGKMTVDDFKKQVEKIYDYSINRT